MSGRYWSWGIYKGSGRCGSGCLCRSITRDGSAGVVLRNGGEGTLREAFDSHETFLLIEIEFFCCYFALVVS